MVFFDEVIQPQSGINRIVTGMPPQPSRYHTVRVVKSWTLPGGAGASAYFDLPGVSVPGIGPDPVDGVWKAFFVYDPQPDPFAVPLGAVVRLIVE